MATLLSTPPATTLTPVRSPPAWTDDGDGDLAANVGGRRRPASRETVLRTAAGSIAQLTPDVVAPGPHPTAVSDSQAVHVAPGHGCDAAELALSAGAYHGHGPEPVRTTGSVAELAVIVIAPGTHPPSSEQGQAVGRACGQREHGREKGCSLWPTTGAGVVTTQFSPVWRLQVVPSPSWPSELEPQLTAVPRDAPGPGAGDPTAGVASVSPRDAAASSIMADHSKTSRRRSRLPRMTPTPRCEICSRVRTLAVARPSGVADPRGESVGCMSAGGSPVRRPHSDDAFGSVRRTSASSATRSSRAIATACCSPLSFGTLMALTVGIFETDERTKEVQPANDRTTG